MRIARVSVQNFRCFSNSEKWAFNWLPKADLNLLIGPNGAGKTALVDAIDIVLNAEGRTNRTLITEYDFPCCDTTKTIMIEIVLVDIGTAIEKFTDYIQFFDKKDFEPIDDRDEIPDETTHERGVLIRFEGMFDKEEGEIQRKWILPKFRETEYEEMKELSRRQHDAIDYFRIQPAITGGAFTLGEYSALGRRLRKLNYKLGRLPDQLKPTQTLPQCKWDCENCVEEETCTAVVDHTDDEATSPQPLGKMMSAITDKAKSMLGVNAWSEMATSFGPRYGGLKTALAAITLGLRHPQAEEAFIPFERFSAGEKYALSFALAATTLTGSDTPIIVMEEPETALYPSAIGQIMANLQAKNSPQVVVTSHSEAVVRRFALPSIFRMNQTKTPERLDRISADSGVLRELERLVTPGATSALFVDKVLVVEGGGDAFATGFLDRLAGMVTSEHAEQKSLASLGWSVFSANRADHVPTTVDVLKKLGVKPAALFDADQPGRDNANKTKSKCPVFTYVSSHGSEITLELALFHGLDEGAKKEALQAFQKYAECSTCGQAKDVRNCLNKNGCPLTDSKDVLKKGLRDCCLEQYRQRRLFPRAFASLAEQLDDATPGQVIELQVDYQAG